MKSDFDKKIEELERLDRENYELNQCELDKKYYTGKIDGMKEGRELIVKEEIEFIKKVKEQLKGYSCGYHKKLDNMLDNRLKNLI